MPRPCSNVFFWCHESLGRFRLVQRRCSTEGVPAGLTESRCKAQTDHLAKLLIGCWYICIPSDRGLHYPTIITCGLLKVIGDPDGPEAIIYI